VSQEKPDKQEDNQQSSDTESAIPVLSFAVEVSAKTENQDENDDENNHSATPATRIEAK
jgi:hypothetical protein